MRLISVGIVPSKALSSSNNVSVELRIKMQDTHEHTYKPGQIGDSRKCQQDSPKLVMRPISVGIVPVKVLYERSKVAVEWRIKVQDKHEHTYMYGHIANGRKWQEDLPKFFMSPTSVGIVPFKKVLYERSKVAVERKFIKFETKLKSKYLVRWNCLQCDSVEKNELQSVNVYTHQMN